LGVEGGKIGSHGVGEDAVRRGSLDVLEQRVRESEIALLAGDAIRAGVDKEV
jgi:hypothetical protein